MKSLVLCFVVAALAFPFAACDNVSHTESTHRNWDGSVTRQDTTVREGIDGSVSVDKSKSTTR